MIGKASETVAFSEIGPTLHVYNLRCSGGRARFRVGIRLRVGLGFRIGKDGRPADARSMQCPCRLQNVAD